MNEPASIFEVNLPHSNSRDKSLNPAIDTAIKKLMKKIDDQPPDVAVKILAQAISWEKVKHGARAEGEELDPDSL